MTQLKRTKLRKTGRRQGRAGPVSAPLAFGVNRWFSSRLRSVQIEPMPALADRASNQILRSSQKIQNAAPCSGAARLVRQWPGGYCLRKIKRAYTARAAPITSTSPPRMPIIGERPPSLGGSGWAAALSWAPKSSTDWSPARTFRV